MLANGVKETTATTGTGTVTLAAATGFVRFSQAFAVGALVSYAIRDGDNWEWGIGAIGAANTLVRAVSVSKLEAGVFYAETETRLTLSGSAEVICDFNSLSGRSALSDAIMLNKEPGAHKYFGDDIAAAIATISLSSGNAYFVPFTVKERTVLTALGVVVTATGAGTISVGIYSTGVSSGRQYPMNVLVSASVTPNATGHLTAAVNYTLTPGVLYWAAIKSNGTATLRALAAGTGRTRIGRQANNGSPLTMYIDADPGGPAAFYNPENPLYVAASIGQVPAISYTEA